MPHATAHASVPQPSTGFESTPLHLKAASAAHTASSSSGGGIMRTVIGLIIVIAVIYALTWVVRKVKVKDLPKAGDGLERVASLPLGTNRSVALIRVGNELHLLGVAEHGVTGIRHFSEDEAIELGLPVAAPGTGITTREETLSGFAQMLKAVTNRHGRADTLDSLRRITQR